MKEVSKLLIIISATVFVLSIVCASVLFVLFNYNMFDNIDAAAVRNENASNITGNLGFPSYKHKSNRNNVSFAASVKNPAENGGREKKDSWQSNTQIEQQSHQIYNDDIDSINQQNQFTNTTRVEDLNKQENQQPMRLEISITNFSQIDNEKREKVKQVNIHYRQIYTLICYAFHCSVIIRLN